MLGWFGDRGEVSGAVGACDLVDTDTAVRPVGSVEPEQTHDPVQDTPEMRCRLRGEPGNGVERVELSTVTFGSVLDFPRWDLGPDRARSSLDSEAERVGAGPDSCAGGTGVRVGRALETPDALGARALTRHSNVVLTGTDVVRYEHGAEPDPAIGDAARDLVCHASAALRAQG